MDEMSWKSFRGSATSDYSKEVFQSEKERLLKEEREALRTEEHAGKSNAMGLLPFTLDVNLLRAAQALNANNDDISVLELFVVGEHISLTSATASAAEGNGIGTKVCPAGTIESFKDCISAEHGRFYVIKCPTSSITAGTFFIYSCPETTPVRMRMTLSSCKATVIAKLTAEAGLAFTKTIEIREPGDIDDYLSQSADGSSNASSADGLSSARATLTHVKPKSAAGRGGPRSRVGKFVADT